MTQEGTPVPHEPQIVTSRADQLLARYGKQEIRPYRSLNRSILYTAFSTEDDAAYIRVNSGEVVRTEVVKDGLHIDYDADGDIVGVELVGYGLRQNKENEASNRARRRTVSISEPDTSSSDVFRLARPRRSGRSSK